MKGKLTTHTAETYITKYKGRQTLNTLKRYLRMKRKEAEEKREALV